MSSQNDDGVDAPTAPSDHSTINEENFPVRTHPTIRPTLVWLAIVVTLGVMVVAYVYLDPDRFGNPQTANLLVRVVVLLTGIGVIRFVIRIFILRRTEYVVDRDTIRRQYELFFRTWQREVPISMVRSSEFRQGRIQKALGYGTIAVNQGLGSIEFENVSEPHKINKLVNELIRQQRDVPAAAAE